MRKDFKTGEIREILTTLNANWEAAKEIKLPTKELYNLISIKRDLESQVSKIQETLETIALSHGGERLENGGIKIPDENIKAANEDLNKFLNEKIEIDFKQIVITENDFIPVPLFEAAFDFIITD